MRGPEPTFNHSGFTVERANSGGTTVTITGTSLGCVTTRFGGVLASDVAAPTSTTVVVTAPPGSVGPVTLTVQNPNVGANANATASTSFFHYTTPGAPAIQSVTPGETQAAINFTVPASDGGAAITGYEYTLDGGTSWAAASSITSPIVIGSLTASTSYAVALRAINLAGAGTASATRSFSTNPPPPAISSVSPNTGAAAGGTVVTITGSLLTGATAVSFGSTAAASFTVDSAMQITATTPAGTAGTADVSVTTAGGTAISAGAFTYVSDITRPTITLSGPAGPVTEPFRLTATFSEAVTGFDAADITVANGTLSNFKEVTAGTVFTVLVTPVMGKTVSAGMPTKAVSDAAGNPNEASNRYSVKSGSVQAVFDSYKDDIRQIIQDQAEKRLTTLMNDNGRMMQDARTRFIGFAGTSESTAAGITPSGFEPIALDVDGTLEMSGDPAGIVAASSGTLLGQTGLINGANWRLSGNFDVLISDGESLAAFDGRVAREQFISHDILWDAFGGGQFSSSDIADAFNGTEPTWQLYAGLYGVAKLTDNLFADA